MRGLYTTGKAAGYERHGFVQRLASHGFVERFFLCELVLRMLLFSQTRPCLPSRGTFACPSLEACVATPRGLQAQGLGHPAEENARTNAEALTSSCVIVEGPAARYAWHSVLVPVLLAFHP